MGRHLAVPLQLVRAVLDTTMWMQNMPRAGADGAPRGPTALQWAGDRWAAGVSALASAAFSFTMCYLLTP